MNNSLEELKEFMSRATDVKEWNTLRELAKKTFTKETIFALDPSGYIKKVLAKTA